MGQNPWLVLDRRENIVKLCDFSLIKRAKKLLSILIDDILVCWVDWRSIFVSVINCCSLWEANTTAADKGAWTSSSCSDEINLSMPRAQSWSDIFAIISIIKKFCRNIFTELCLSSSKEHFFLKYFRWNWFIRKVFTYLSDDEWKRQSAARWPLILPLAAPHAPNSAAASRWLRAPGVFPAGTKYALRLFQEQCRFNQVLRTFVNMRQRSLQTPYLIALICT